MKKKITAILLVVALALALVVPAASVGASPGPGIVGLWHFDGDADDDSGNGYNGTLHGDATYVDVESEMPGFDRALSLDGNGDYVEVAHAIAVTSAITMEAWVKVDAPISTDAEVISKWDGVGNGVIHFEIAPDLKVRMCLRDGTGINDYIVNFYSTEALPSDQWVHVAEVWDGTTATIYFDGVAKGSQSGSGTIRHNSSMKYWIGSAYGTMRFFDGLIDEVRIWDEALPLAQIGDVTAPVVTINDPDDGAYYQTAAVPTADYTVVDANSYTVVESGYSTAEGVQTYTVTATDVLGYVGSDSVTYTVDNTLPVVTITAPDDGGFYLAGAVPAGAYTVVELNPYTVVETGWSDSEGMHTYTVTATDAAGNVGSDSVTYYVLENFVTGGGNIKDGKKPAWTFAGVVGNLEDDCVGQFQIVDHAGKVSYHCNNTFSSLVFSGSAIVGPPGPDASNSIATFTGTFTNNRDDSTVEITVVITDVNEPGTGWDTISISSTGPSVSSQTIDGGNFQVHDLPDDDLF